MLRSTASRRDLAAGLLLSLGVHVVVGGVFGTIALSGGAAASADAVTTLLPDELPSEPAPTIILGNGERPIDTVNWLGADSPKELEAPRSEVEQPELSLEPGAAPEAAPRLPPLPLPAAAVLRPADAAPLNRAVEGHAPDEGAAESTRGAPASNILVAAVPIEAVALPVPAATVPPVQPSSAPPGRGLRSTSETAAAALKDSVSVVPGGVISAKGLQISTVRPEWAVATRVTRMPGNPVLQITFRRDGKAGDVRFLSDGTREYRTGFVDVDEPLVTALFRWTARGDALDRLPEGDPDAGVTVTFKILLTRG
ncbi:MAG: hypothetical protein IT437_12405 [Phycisphaerales bacterium]|nr:hypothetical protein [Phycisphaerales bacterium]